MQHQYQQRHRGVGGVGGPPPAATAAAIGRGQRQRRSGAVFFGAAADDRNRSDRRQRVATGSSCRRSHPLLGLLRHHLRLIGAFSSDHTRN